MPKLPAPQEEDLSQGILESIDMDSYRAEKKATIALALSDENVLLDPTEIGGSGHKPEPELDRLSNIINQFNALFGNIPFDDKDKVMKLITEEIPAKVAADRDYQNAMQNSDRENARQQGTAGNESGARHAAGRCGGSLRSMGSLLRTVGRGNGGGAGGTGEGSGPSGGNAGEKQRGLSDSSATTTGPNPWV